MAREVLAVCLPPVEPASVRQAVAEAMAPYDHNNTQDGLPAAEWDAWWMGAAGREYGIRQGMEDDPRLIRECEPTREGQTYVVPWNRCSGGPLELLDIEGQRSRAVAAADELWQAWTEFSAGFPPADTLEDLIAQEPGATLLHAGPAWHRYAAQPVMRAVLNDPALSARFGQRAVGDFAVGRDAFLRRAACASVAQDALLTLDGEWIAPVSPQDHEFAGTVDRYIDTVAPDAVLVNITYHS
ncbi:hypothetical protein [Streptomyces griseosporeus]|uniref:hypothetical protein n=1 Tax=Streptomyces griseosporeus TaxID=1910 RepID=UPI0036FDA8A8